MSFGLALSVGHESDAEYLDLELAEAVDPDGLAERLTPRAARGHGRHRRRARSSTARRRCRKSITAVAVAGRDRRRPRPARSGRDVLDAAASTRAMASDALLDRSHPQGQGERGRHPSRDPLHRGRRDDGDTPVLELTLSTQSRGARPREVLDASTRSSASASPSTASPEHTNGSNATARGWSRWKPTRSRPSSRRSAS